ncbi:carbohydrate ABC transporter permease [Streptomyces europaeiscabiei]|uniref:Sugar ABC transporter permease n=1 Tax=Streptomyces europaeiscabiei TaxID=146819 RepID=A0ABU4NJL2_9ACTN|nr:sugar ABC transporter permease [Streptomyces europaeiscabiei]MDX2524499.1 sugar ABC transporter permease [Streptomyces europaeiscabiei]MDX2768036.1 sugar ABC transporter permease [Streptomyces europaeiscabiei]MDX3545763.1 sugar ABC transporter permease [Streptomyces europaeiscabiei]MDX3554839.1 sugar ABC transporter permease [Streptomyces europaeiscabiei]MDX3672813.1 sugar ABC transporter permease [Streptomyces europaeiscabiei]
MALPALLLFALFALVPMVIVVYLSFTRWDGLGSPAWTGLDNWRTALTSDVTRHALWLTAKLMVFSWIVQTPISLLLGVFVAGKQRYRALLGVFYFVPLLISTAAIAVIFKNLLDPNFGLGAALHLSFLGQDWLGDPQLAFYTVVFVISWQFVPFHTLLYQAGARQIPASLYEAASIDGAGRLAQFWHITLPQLRYTIVTSSTLMVVGSLTYFDLVFVLTGGGPGYATRILPLDMYITGFQSNQMGLASAVSVVLVAAGLLVSLALVRFSGFSRMRSQQAGM